MGDTHSEEMGELADLRLPAGILAVYGEDQLRWEEGRHSYSVRRTLSRISECRSLMLHVPHYLYSVGIRADAILPDTACQICEILLGAAQRFFRCGSSTLMTNVTGAVSLFSHDPMKRFNFKSAPRNIQHLIQLCPGLS